MTNRLSTAFSHSLQLQLVSWVLLLALPSVLLGGWLVTAIYQALSDSFQNTARMTARHAMASIDKLLFERYSDVRVFSQLPAVRALDRPKLVPIANQMVTIYAPYYQLAFVVDREGTILAANTLDGRGEPVDTTPLLGRRVAGEPWFEEARRGTQPVVVQDVHRDPLSEAVFHDAEPVLSFSAPIRSADGTVVGVWSVRLAAEPITGMLTDLSRAYAESAPLPLTLFDRSGAVLSHSEPALAHTKRPPLATADSAGYSHFPGFGWHLQVCEPVHWVDSAKHLALAGGAWGLLVTGGLAGLGLLVGRRVVGPIHALADHAQQLTKIVPAPFDASDPFLGGRSTAAPNVRPDDDRMKPADGAQRPTRLDEIGHLEQSFAEMTDRVHGQVFRLHALNTVSQQLQREAYSQDTVLRMIVHAAAQLTGARYGALGVFDETGERLTQFITTGMDQAAQEAIGRPPTGTGLLGYLKKEAGVLRLKDLTTHPAAIGFPANHPPMHSFLGISIRAHGQLFGRLYLTEKHDAAGAPAEFTEIDEETLSALAVQAGTAIEAASLINTVRTTKAKYRLLLDSTAEGIFGLDQDGICMFINRAAATLLGYGQDELIGKPMHLTIHHHHKDGAVYSEADCPIYSAMKTASSTLVDEDVFWRKDGTAFPVEYTSRPIVQDGLAVGAVVTFTDITTRKRLEEQLRQSQKLDAIGQLAGGIAHDFNNLLTVINGFSEILLVRLPPDHPGHRSATLILQAGRRAAELTKQLLAFSRKQAWTPRVFDVNACVTDMCAMIERLVGSQIACCYDIPDTPYGIRADHNHIEQVLMNLAVNARDAMPEGGTLRIGTTLVESANEPDVPAGMPPGTYVRLSVKDTGCGMDEATKSRIFEPFFTTKGPGQGTGLGLSTVYGIVARSNGHIGVSSAVGQGTEFRIYFPYVGERADVPSSAPAAASVPAKAGATALVVDDNPGVVSFAQEALCAAGWSVLTGRERAQGVCRRRGARRPDRSGPDRHGHAANDRSASGRGAPSDAPGHEDHFHVRLYGRPAHRPSCSIPRRRVPVQALYRGRVADADAVALRPFDRRSAGAFLTVRRRFPSKSLYVGTPRTVECRPFGEIGLMVRELTALFTQLCPMCRVRYGKRVHVRESEQIYRWACLYPFECSSCNIRYLAFGRKPTNQAPHNPSS